MTSSDLLAAHFSLRASRLDEDAYYQACANDTAVSTLRLLLAPVLSRVASGLAPRVAAARAGWPAALAVALPAGYTAEVVEGTDGS